MNEKYHGSMTTQIYPSNHLDKLTNFEKFKMNEFNRLNEDDCYIQERTNDNKKKLKYVTTNHIDLINGHNYNYFGINMKDENWVPGDKIDTYSSLLNGDSGHKLTNCNIKSEFGQLPISTLPYRGSTSHGDVNKEDSIRNQLCPKKKSTLKIESEYNKRVYNIFDDSQCIETPDPTRSVERKENGFFTGRNGISTRTLFNTKSEFYKKKLEYNNNYNAYNEHTY